MSRACPVVLLCAALCAGVFSQDPGEKSVEGRLLEILKQRGVITDAEFGELRKLETDLRNQSDLEAKVDHRVSEMVAKMAEDGPKLSYKGGSGLTVKTADGRFSMNVGGRIQVRATYFARENENGSQNGEDLQDIGVQRARVWMKGFAWDPNLKYEIQFDVAGSFARPLNAATTGFDSDDTSANRVPELRYGYVDWQICKNKPWWNLKAGQFKVPYSRQQLCGSGKLQFVDRGPVDSAFAPGFSPGIMFWGRRGGEKDDLFEYYAGAFDGSGDVGIAEGFNIQNNDDGLLYAARVAVNPFGGLAYSEADLRSCCDRRKFLVQVGANAWYHQDNNRSASLDNFDDWAVGADATIAWQGVYATAEAHYRSDMQPTIGGVAVPDVEAFGWMAQLGYMIVPQRFEVGLRYEEVDWNDTTAVAPPTVPTNSASREYLLVLGYYWHEHDMKLQLDFGRNEQHFADNANGGNPNNVDEWRTRVQFSLSF